MPRQPQPVRRIARFAWIGLLAAPSLHAAGIGFEPPDWPGYVALGALVVLVVGLLIGAAGEPDGDEVAVRPEAPPPLTGASRRPVERRRSVRRTGHRRSVPIERRVR